MDICHSSFSGELLDLGLGVRESMQVVLPSKKRIVCCFGEQLVDAKLVTVSNSSFRLRGKKTYNKGVYVQDLPRGNSSFSVFSSTIFPSLQFFSFSQSCALFRSAALERVLREGREWSTQCFVCKEKKTLPSLRKQMKRSCWSKSRRQARKERSEKGELEARESRGDSGGGTRRALRWEWIQGRSSQIPAPSSSCPV